ncbi:MAG: sensor domain-containing diguanylate cyclase [Acidobacteriota bacterium]|nr:sensor domain-containing diguanylate cyclase [Acidobacteriota bacterium]
MQSTRDFAAASESVLRFLHERLGFNLWMVTRTEDKDWIVLKTEDHGYGIRPPVVFSWADTLCSRMLEGRGPRMSPYCSEVPAYAAAPLARQLPIEAYIGVPLRNPDGSLFGTLCAIDPKPQPRAITGELPLVELLAEMLSSVLAAELRASESERHTERIRRDAEIDRLTSIYNRRGLDRLLDLEEKRCARYGHPACVIVVDLDALKEVNDTQGHAAGDELIRRAAATLRAGARVNDIVARIGGDEFVVIGLESDEAEAHALAERLRWDLDHAGIAASLGFSVREPLRGLTHACAAADQAMYRNKALRKLSALSIPAHSH